MAASVRWRRHRLRGRQGAWPRLRLLAALAAPLAALGLAPVAMAQPALSVGTGLLPSVLPTVCVGGILLCPGSLVTLPVSPPVPLPSVCVSGVACTGDVVGTSPTPTPAATATPPPRATPTPRPTPITSGSPTPVPASISVGGPLPAPPGVGIVPQPQAQLDASLGPDSFATLLSLSLRDGLGSARYHLWPWLLLAQLLLWTAIAVITWSRQLSANAALQGR